MVELKNNLVSFEKIKVTYDYILGIFLNLDTLYPEWESIFISIREYEYIKDVILVIREEYSKLYEYVIKTIKENSTCIFLYECVSGRISYMNYEIRVLDRVIEKSKKEDLSIN